MPIPRNTAPDAGAAATPSTARLRRRAVMAGNLVAASGLFFFAACSESGLTEPGAPARGARGPSPAAVAPTGAPSHALVGAPVFTTVGDTTVVRFTIDPTTSTAYQLGPHKVQLAANAICDPANLRNGYGPRFWGAPCTLAKSPINFTAKSWTGASGRPVVVFSPDVRFAPGTSNRIWLMDPTAAALGRDPLTWCPTGTTSCVDEAISDPSLATSYTSDGFATRPIKHFSGYTLGFGRQSGATTTMPR